MSMNYLGDIAEFRKEKKKQTGKLIGLGVLGTGLVGAGLYLGTKGKAGKQAVQQVSKRVKNQVPATVPLRTSPVASVAKQAPVEKVTPKIVSVPKEIPLAKQAPVEKVVPTKTVSVPEEIPLAKAPVEKVAPKTVSVQKEIPLAKAPAEKVAAKTISVQKEIPTVKTPIEKVAAKKVTPKIVSVPKEIPLAKAPTKIVSAPQAPVEKVAAKKVAAKTVSVQKELPAKTPIEKVLKQEPVVPPSSSIPPLAKTKETQSLIQAIKQAEVAPKKPAVTSTSIVPLSSDTPRLRNIENIGQKNTVVNNNLRSKDVLVKGSSYTNKRGTLVVRRSSYGKRNKLINEGVSVPQSATPRNLLNRAPSSRLPQSGLDRYKQDPRLLDESNPAFNTRVRPEQLIVSRAGGAKNASEALIFNTPEMLNKTYKNVPEELRKTVVKTLALPEDFANHLKQVTRKLDDIHPIPNQRQVAVERSNIKNNMSGSMTSLPLGSLTEKIGKSEAQLKQLTAQLENLDNTTPAYKSLATQKALVERNLEDFKTGFNVREPHVIRLNEAYLNFNGKREKATAVFLHEVSHKFDADLGKYKAYASSTPGHWAKELVDMVKTSNTVKGQTKARLANEEVFASVMSQYYAEKIDPSILRKLNSTGGSPYNVRFPQKTLNPWKVNQQREWETLRSFIDNSILTDKVRNAKTIKEASNILEKASPAEKTFAVEKLRASKDTALLEDIVLSNNADSKLKKYMGLRRQESGRLAMSSEEKMGLQLQRNTLYNPDEILKLRENYRKRYGVGDLDFEKMGLFKRQAQYALFRR